MDYWESGMDVIKIVILWCHIESIDCCRVVGEIIAMDTYIRHGVCHHGYGETD